MRKLQEADLKDKIVLVRVDYNVPMEGEEVVDDLRIRASLPTLEFLRKAGAKKIILISHLGRPEGKVVPEFSLAPVAKSLAKLIPRVSFVPEVSGELVEAKASELKDGEILVLENLRFYAGEEENSKEFIHKIIEATGAEIFVQDGFAALHRAHASTVAVAEFLPAYAGLLVEKEVEGLSRTVENPEKPVVLVIGGSKVEDKKPLIEKFLGIADKILVGGKIAADGFLVPPEEAEQIYVAEDFDINAEGEKLDVGPVATARMAEEVAKARTVIWNGLLGKAEDPAYATSSTIMAAMLGEKTEGLTVVCGGDTTGFVEKVMEEHPNFQYGLISTGGGAALEFLIKGFELPGLKVLL